MFVLVQKKQSWHITPTHRPILRRSIGQVFLQNVTIWPLEPRIAGNVLSLRELADLTTLRSLSVSVRHTLFTPRNRKWVLGISEAFAGTIVSFRRCGVAALIQSKAISKQESHLSLLDLASHFHIWWESVCNFAMTNCPGV